MATNDTIGTLSADEARFVATVAQHTGLDATLVRAWVGCETGWGVTKASHNYLNIGPGRSYPSTDAAALATISLLSSSSHYAGIRAAVPKGGAAQLAAIKASPWDAGHYGNGCLDKAYAALAGQPAPADVTGLPGSATAPGVSGPAAANAGLLPGLDDILPMEELYKIGVGLVLLVGGLGVIALGLWTLTGTSPREGFERVSSVAGPAATAAALVK